jgi:hypothetical protein
LVEVLNEPISSIIQKSASSQKLVASSFFGAWALVEVLNEPVSSIISKISQ